MFSLHQIEGPQAEPVSAGFVKLHTRIDQAAEDSLLEAYIATARQYAEAFTKRQLITATFELHLDCFPAGLIEVPLPPLQSIVGITYLDVGGVEQTWDPLLYDVDAPSGPCAQKARVAPAYGETYPATRSVMAAVKVRFTCGYGSADDVPMQIRQAITLGVAEQYENREQPDLAKAMRELLRAYAAY